MSDIDWEAEGRRAAELALALCATPSPSGYAGAAAELVAAELARAGLVPERRPKGAVACSLGGEGRPLLLAAHVDTLGAVVRAVKPNGRLRYSKIGGYPDLSVVGETCVVHCRSGARFTGTFQPVEASSHVNAKLKDTKPDEDNVEILVDERCRSRAEALALGIAPGDIVSIDARPVLTPSGFLKSRHLDDKASAGVLLALAGLVASGRLRPARALSLLFTAYEEVGHGGSSIPPGIEEMIAVDMGAVGEDLGCDEYKVSICAKDSAGPCDWETTNALIAAAKAAGVDYAVDVYPSYSSDADAALRAGHALRHAIVGPGVYASHGYERTHLDAVRGTLRLLAAYVEA